MTVERNAATIADLDINLPAKGDYISEGDDHLRLIKTTLKNSFKTVDEPLDVEFSQLNNLGDYVTIHKTTRNNAQFNTISGNDPLLITNLLAGTADTDATSVATVKSLINTVLLNTVYRVGQYFISDQNIDPRTYFPGTTWVPVVGFLAGVGTYNGTLSGLNYQFQPGPRQGHAHIPLKATDLPKTSIDLSAYSTAKDGDHQHIFGGDDSVGEIGYTATSQPHGNRDQDSDDNDNLLRDYRTKSDGANTAHSHKLSGHLNLNPGTQTYVEVVPPYTGVYVFRRTK